MLFVKTESTDKGVALNAGTTMEVCDDSVTEPSSSHLHIGRQCTAADRGKMCVNRTKVVSEAMMALLVRVIGCLGGGRDCDRSHKTIPTS